MLVLIPLLVFLPALAADSAHWRLPINTKDRASWNEVRLTPIGDFGIMRKPRPNVPAHLHTGIDLMRPGQGNNYENEPVFATAKGIVIAIRSDGPFAQIIIEHNFLEGEQAWSAYEHVSGIRVHRGQTVDAQTQIARYMNWEEIAKYGKQFDHLHFEVLKVKPRPIHPVSANPDYLFATYNLVCYNEADLERYYRNPRELFVGR